MPQPFKPSSKMIFTTVEEDRSRFIKYCDNNHAPQVTIDLSKVEECDSAGLALLIEVKRLCKAKQQSCQIEKMTKAMLALAEFCGVESLLMP